MRKLFAIALALILALSLAACGGNNNSNNSTPPSSTPTPPANNTPSTPPSSTPDNTSGNGGDSSNEEKIAEADVIGKTIENKQIVARYTGDDPDYGAPRQYLVIKGFESDGSFDILGTSRIFSFYDDEASYEAGLAKALVGGEFYIKQQNKTSLFFEVSAGYPNDWENFNDAIEKMDANALSDNYSAVYEVVR